MLVEEGEEFKYKLVILKECFDNFIVIEVVEFGCIFCSSKDGFFKCILFKIFFEVFVVNVCKMVVVNWVFVKVDVFVFVDDEFFVLDSYLFKG